MTTCASLKGATWLEANNKPIIWRSLPITWTFSDNFRPDIKPVFRNGLEYWNHALHTQVFKEIECDGVCIFQSPKLIIFEGLEFVSSDVIAHTEHNIDGVYVTSATMLYMPQFLMATPDTQLEVIRHEAGHVLGLGHNDKPTCVMYPAIDLDEGLKEACDDELNLVRSQYLK
jgi:hypothetical protein